MNLKHYFILFFIIITQSFFSQIKIGEWQDYLTYNTTNSVSKIGDIIYVSNKEGLAKYNVNDHSIEKLTKIDGLSDVGISVIRKNDYNDVLIVIYENSNIDLILPNGKIFNISDLKRKIIAGNKTIYEVYCKNKLAYLSCGFGIIVIDTEKFEIKETYKIGNGTTFKEVRQITSSDSAIYAATESGIYYGLFSKNLSNYQNWKPLNIGITAGPYNSIINFNGKIMANYSGRLASNFSFADTVWQFDGFLWSKYPYKTNSENFKLYDYSKYGKMLIMDRSGLSAFTSTGMLGSVITGYGYLFDVYYEGSSNYWFADLNYGLMKSNVNAPFNYEFISIAGPSSNYVNDLSILDGNLAIAPTNLGDIYTFQYNNTKPNLLQNTYWERIINLPDSIKDYNCVAIDPKDKNHIIFGCLGYGVVEIKNKVFSNVYNTSNSTMVGYNNGYQLWTTGVSFDKNSNIWVMNSASSRAVSVLKNGNWNNLNFDYIISKPTIPKIIFDKNNQAWMILARGGGIMVYKDVNGLSQPSTTNTKILTVAKGNGFLPTPDVYAICEDLEGKIWVGTSKGITVFYNPENVFTNSNFDSQQILIEQDNHVQILLENDIITSIAIDGVNRKWVGTESSGIYCFSADGQTQIYHFTTENSPLYSNVIRDIVTDETTGDVFFATVKGIQSYRTSIIKGYDNFTNMHAFPNPIRPGYTGTIHITGLIDEASVKITDVAGNLVWESKSQGGQLEWDLKNFSGSRVTSGVYLIYGASANGEKSATAKLLVIN